MAAAWSLRTDGMVRTGILMGAQVTGALVILEEPEVKRHLRVGEKVGNLKTCAMEAVLRTGNSKVGHS